MDLDKYECDGSMTYEEILECDSSVNHVMVGRTLNDDCYCACQEDETCPTGSMIRELPDCECECNPELGEQHCESYQVFVKTPSGQGCLCMCDENKKSQCNSPKVWYESRCSCECPSGDEHDCPSRFVKNENCECVCDPEHPNNQCNGAQKLLFSDLDGCHCACEDNLRTSCIGYPNLEFHEDLEERGYMFRFDNNTCNCALTKADTGKVTVETLFPDDILSCGSHNHKFHLSSGECVCRDHDDPHRTSECYSGSLKVNESTCECDCLDRHVHSCNKFSGTLEKVYADGNLGYCQCTDYNRTTLSLEGNSGDSMIIVKDGEPFYYTGRLQNAEQDIIATSAILSPFTEIEEELEIEDITTNEESGQVEITFKQPLENKHEAEAEIAPVFLSSLKSMSSSSHTISDPHIKTFFNESYKT